MTDREQSILESKSRDLDAPGAKRPPFQFSLRALFALTTGASVLLSIGVIVPWLGIVLTILLLPGVVRTFIRTAHSNARGQRYSRGIYFGLFLFDVGRGMFIVLGAFAISFAAFLHGVDFARAFGLQGHEGMCGIIAAIVGGMVTGGWLVWYCWIRPDRDDLERLVGRRSRVRSRS